MAKAKRLVICLDNVGYEVALERLKIYVALPDAKAERTGYLRIIDESGEDSNPTLSANREINSAGRPYGKFRRTLLRDHRRLDFRGSRFSGLSSSRVDGAALLKLARAAAGAATPCP